MSAMACADGLMSPRIFYTVFFFNDTATTEIYTLSLHDALPIFAARLAPRDETVRRARELLPPPDAPSEPLRSEEHTSELQSQSNLVCRLLLEKKNITVIMPLLSACPPLCCPTLTSWPSHTQQTS